jgi:bifunctional non-homologous end joining protein LigD
VKLAKELHQLLSQEGAEALVKTSGKTGLHVLAPWRKKAGYDAAREWAMEVAGRLVDELPEIATTERLKAERHGRVYVDVIQNARGHHVVPPYVLRAVAEATVSTPLDWKEVTGRLNPKRFTTKRVLKRVGEQKADPFAAVASD